MNQKPIFCEGIGRRKSSIAKVQIISGTGQLVINQKPGLDYLDQNPSFIRIIEPVKMPKSFFDSKNGYDILVQVKGGGTQGQAAAIQLGLARALCKFNDSYRPILKEKGLLKRDARVKERKKIRLKKSSKSTTVFKTLIEAKVFFRKTLYLQCNPYGIDCSFARMDFI